MKRGLILAFAFGATKFSHRGSCFHLTPRNCSAVDQFPAGLISDEDLRKGWISLYVVVAIYLFIALAIACDEYFVPSLECICQRLQLQEDVAGATFMAAGSSAPELATALIAVFVAKNDIGLGTVVGSAVFNIMFVISASALFAGMVIPLLWWPMVRDCIFYAISIGALTLVIVDEKVFWYEAVILLLLYVIYILLMVFNVKIEGFVRRICCCQTEETTFLVQGSIEVIDEDIEECTAILLQQDSTAVADDGLHEDHLVVHVTPSLQDEAGLASAQAPCWKMVAPPADAGFPRKLYWFISLPVAVCMCLTVPDCRRRPRCFIATFLLSMVWIGGLSYVLVWMVMEIGYVLGITDDVMGLTFLAAGVSVPDAIASVIVARDGKGDMAISNAIGSNVFDILLCLGLPWLIETAFVNPGSAVVVQSKGLMYSTLTLLGTVVLLLLATHCNKWKLDKPYGVFLMLVYFGFTALSVVYIVVVFGSSPCPRNYS